MTEQEQSLDPFGESFWDWRKQERAGSAEAASVLFKGARTAWARGNFEHRDFVLVYLAMSHPTELVDLVWEATKSDDDDIRSTGAIAAMSYLDAGHQPGPDEIELLKAVVARAERGTTGGLALHALDLVEVPDWETWLEKVALESRFPGLRFDANLRLLDAGRGDVRDSLLRDMRAHDYPDHAATLLWGRREQLDLSRAEEAEIRSHVVAEMDHWRRGAKKFYKEHPNRSALVAFHWITEGFPYSEADIDALGMAARRELDIEDRLKAVRALAWFKEDQAREWLEKLARTGRPVDVRTEARRQLEQNAGKD